MSQSLGAGRSIERITSPEGAGARFSAPERSDMRHLVGSLFLVTLVIGGVGTAVSRPAVIARQESLPVSPSLIDQRPMFMGVASCASTACHHGGGGKEMKRSEYSTWSAHDFKHRQAYNVLLED